MIYPFGPLLEAWRVARLDRAFPAPLPVAVLGEVGLVRPDAQTAILVPPSRLDALARLAAEIAAGEIGHGETEGNNRGEWIRTYCAPAGDGHEWCAAFAGWAYQRAAEQLALPLPFARSLGAKRLGKNAAQVGRRFPDAREARAGDLVIWDRGAAGSWSGHVGMVERVLDEHAIVTIEGNSGVNVRRRQHDLSRERFAFFASIRVAP